VLDTAVAELTSIAGQKPSLRRRRNRSPAFKLRQDMPIGVMVTLRGERMYEFFDRLVSVALPRVRDFRGVSPKAFDGRGNYTIGIREQLIFPEIDFNKVDKLRGMNISIVTTARNDDQARRF
jgi:large subunit ribosomal protein L5